MQEVQVRAIVENRAADRDADRTPEIAHQVEQPGGELQSLRRQAAERQGDDRRQRELLAEAAQRLRQQQLPPTPLVSDGDERPHAQGEAEEAEHHQPPQVDASGQRGVEGNRADLEQAGREHREADLQSAEATHAAEEQRREIDRGEDRNSADEREQ